MKITITNIEWIEVKLRENTTFCIGDKLPEYFNVELCEDQIKEFYQRLKYNRNLITNYLKDNYGVMINGLETVKPWSDRKYYKINSCILDPNEQEIFERLNNLKVFL